jgi:hypothetical protein
MSLSHFSPRQPRGQPARGSAPARGPPRSGTGSASRRPPAGPILSSRLPSSAVQGRPAPTTAQHGRCACLISPASPPSSACRRPLTAARPAAPARCTDLHSWPAEKVEDRPGFCSTRPPPAGQYLSREESKVTAGMETGGKATPAPWHQGRSSVPGAIGAFSARPEATEHRRACHAALAAPLSAGRRDPRPSEAPGPRPLAVVSPPRRGRGVRGRPPERARGRRPRHLLPL